MSESQEGSGSRSARTRHNNRLVNRALHERWPIPQALRTSLVNELGKIVQDPHAGNRDVISAAKALLSASKINLESVSASIKAREHGELDERLTEIERKAKARERGAAGY